MDFSGKCAIVTGAARGIGYAAARLLAEDGARVMLVDLNAEGLETARQGIPGAQVFACDVADEGAVNRAVQYAVEKCGKVDILINNAGIYRCDVGLFETSSSAAWKKKIDVNILGTMYFTRAVLDGMLSRGYGRIVNLSSVAGIYGIVKMTDYSMTKAAVLGFTKALAKEVTGRGVTVNAVSPGSIDDDPARMPNHSFMGRAGSFEECARVIRFLASDEASYVSGQNYVVDGCRKLM